MRGGPRERRGLRATMWAPAMGPFCHLKPLATSLATRLGPGAATAQTAATVCPASRVGTRPKARSVACQEIYTRLLTAARHLEAGAGPGVVRCESGPCEQMKAVGGWAEKRGGQARGSGSLFLKGNWASSGLGSIRGAPEA